MTRLPLLLDVAAVLVFVVVGRESHDQANAVLDVAETAAPFLLALGAGWAVVVPRMGSTSLPAGLAIAGATIVAGVALRRLVFGDGIALPFVLVTAGFLTASMVGWRIALRRRYRLADRAH